MIAENQSKSNIGVGIGFVVAAGGRVLAALGASSHNQAFIILGGILSVVGSIVFVWGCVNYAQGKGYSPWLGALGLLGCIGLVVLAIMPDKMKDGGYGGPGMGGSGMGGPGGYVPPQPGVWPPPPGSAPPPAPRPGGVPPPSFGQPPGGPGSEPPSTRKTLGGDDL